MASAADGAASPNPPARNRATSSTLSQRTSDALEIEGLPIAASARHSAALSIRGSLRKFIPVMSAAKPATPNPLLTNPEKPRSKPSGISFNPPRKPSLPGSGAFIMSRYASLKSCPCCRPISSLDIPCSRKASPSFRVSSLFV